MKVIPSAAETIDNIDKNMNVGFKVLYVHKVNHRNLSSCVSVGSVIETNAKKINIIKAQTSPAIRKLVDFFIIPYFQAYPCY